MKTVQSWYIFLDGKIAAQDGATDPENPIKQGNSARKGRTDFPFCKEMHGAGESCRLVAHVWPYSENITLNLLGHNAWRG
jgi:hypothetical protein